MNVFRPKPGETDEDLIKLNAEFLKNVKRKPDNGAEKCEAEGDLKKQKSQDTGNDCIYNDPQIILENAKAPRIMLGDVVERSPALKPSKPPKVTSAGFPEVFKRDKLLSSQGNKKTSIFAQMQRKKAEEAPMDLEEKVYLGAQEAIKNIFGPSEAQKIHEESLQKLSELSEEQIIEERKRLLASLNPETLSFFTSRKQKISTVTEETEKIKKAPLNEENQNQLTIADDMPIKISDAKKWLHMDVVETEKLKWMKKLPMPKPLAPGDPYPARFDFEGNLMPANADVPVTEALHHHGEEPERPGYTLEELLLFSRSSVMQQRTIGISTIANVLRLAKEGRYDLCLEEFIVPQLVGAGVFAVLRFSLDDSVSMVVQASADALKNLLGSEPDEVCLSMMLGTTFGTQQPILACLPVPDEEKEKGEAPVEEGELKDHELLQLDVIKGAIRTDIIQRIRYILEITKADPKTTLSFLDILIRISRHSRESALEVGRCIGLMQTVISQFMPGVWESTFKKPAEMETVYCVPLARAVRLVRVIAAQSKAIASDFVHKYKVMPILMKYLAAEPGETGIPDGAAILIESFYLWQTFLSYGFALKEFNSFSPVFGQLLSFHLVNTTLHAEGTFYQEHATALLKLLQAVLDVDRKLHHEIPQDLVINIGPRIIRATGSWLQQAAENLPLNFSDCKLVGAAITLTKTLFKVLQQWDGVDVLSWLSLIENVTTLSVIPFLLSKTFKLLTDSMLEFSSLLTSESLSGKKRDPKGLPSVGAVTHGQKIISVLQPKSPFFLLQPLISFINFAAGKFSTARNMLLSSLLKNKGIQSYINEISLEGCVGFHNWFARTELYLAADLLLLAAKSDSLDNSHKIECHVASLKLVSCIGVRDKALLLDLFETWVFLDVFSSHEETAFGPFKNLNLLDKQQSQSAITNAITEIPLIRDTFIAAFNLKYEILPEKQNTISLPAESDSLLPVDWPFLPLIKVVGHAQEETKPGDQSATKEQLSINIPEVVRSLQWILLLETVEPQILNKMLSPTARFCRLACVFLAENCLFLEDEVHKYLKEIVRTLLSNLESGSQDFDFNEKIPGLKDFWDLYVQLVQQYSSESYGDTLFAHFIFIPLQQRFGIAFRNLIWGEQIEVVRFLSLPLNELMLPIEKFLEPPETDIALLRLNLKSLITGLVKPTWSPILYQVAIHHIKQYIINGEDRTFAEELKSGLKAAKCEVSS